MRSHSEIGYRIAIESKVLAGVADYILHHHEHWDGNGYPYQLKGHDIPLVCRILSIIDAYDAMINNRPYRSALSPTEAIGELLNDRGRKFQPILVDKFIMYLELTQGVEINRGKIM
jgi:HD-GYP domain-containing protein (c-di-GMP phosphodiesterase class II)